MKAKKYVKSTTTMLAVKKYFNLKVLTSLVASLMLLYAPVALYNYTKENGTLLYNVAEAQISSTVPIAKGTIKTEAVFEETSSYSVNNGFEEAEKNGVGSYSNTSSSNSYQNSRPSSTPTYNNQESNSQIGNTQQNTNQVVKDLSFLKGVSITMVEGDSFNPMTNLDIVAQDKDGTDITNRVSIDENNVDVNNEGSYYVKASVKLNDGSILEKVFTVKVNPKKEVTYEVNNFEMLENTAPKLGTARIFFDSKVSDDTVSPLKATINGIEYNVNNFGKSGFGGTTRHYIDVNVGDISGEFKLNIEKIEFSNGVSVWPNEQMNVYVIKSEPVVSNFSYTEGEEGKISTTFDLKDLDNSLSNIKVSLYNEKGILVEEYKVEKKEKYNLDFSVEANGKYTLEVIGDVNLYNDLNRLNQNRVILSQEIQVSKIDKSNLEASDIEIYAGDELSIENLNIKAFDINGEDITNSVSIDTSNLDASTAGEYSVLVSVINSNNVKLEKVVKVIVKDNEISTKSSIEPRMARAKLVEEREINSNVNTKQLRSFYSNTVSGNNTSQLNSNMKLTGVVYNDQGNPPEGRLEVELPTKINFTVDQVGNFMAASSYNINNRSSCPVEVSIAGFRESKLNDGICVKKDNITDTDPRNVVNLEIRGNIDTVRLYDSSVLDTKIMEIPSQSTLGFMFTGTAGKGSNVDVDRDGVSEDFTVQFKINKKN